MSTNAGKVYVLVVDAWVKGMGEPITYIQPFQPFAVGSFKPLDPAVPVVSGSMLKLEESEPYLTILHHGVSTHGKAVGLWDWWQ